MKFFSKEESIVIISIFLFIGVFAFKNFSLSLQRARDAQRKADLGNLSNSLHTFQRDFGSFPLASADGRIKACEPEDFEDLLLKSQVAGEFDFDIYLEGLDPCDWGIDAIADLSDPNYPSYIETIPKDPKIDEGLSYYYLSNGKRFQLYSHLEGGENEIGYDAGIVARNLFCGDEICSFGKTFGQTPLDKSIEEYENELLEKSRNNR